MTHPIGSGVADYVVRLMNFTAIYSARKNIQIIITFLVYVSVFTRHYLHGLHFVIDTPVLVLALFDNEKDREQSNQQHQSLFISHTSTFK